MHELFNEGLFYLQGVVRSSVAKERNSDYVLYCTSVRVFFFFLYDFIDIIMDAKAPFGMKNFKHLRRHATQD